MTEFRFEDYETFFKDEEHIDPTGDVAMVKHMLRPNIIKQMMDQGVPPRVAEITKWVDARAHEFELRYGSIREKEAASREIEAILRATEKTKQEIAAEPARIRLTEAQRRTMTPSEKIAYWNSGFREVPQRFNTKSRNPIAEKIAHLSPPLKLEYHYGLLPDVLLRKK